VADNSTSSKNGGLTRGKAILIGVLALVLVVVLYLQFGRSGSKGVASDGRGYVPRRPVPAAAAAATPEASPATQGAVKQVLTDNKPPTATTAAVFNESRWKSPPLVEVVSYDPFAVPAAFPKAEVSDPTQPNQNLVATAAAEDQKKLIDAVARLQMQLEQIKQRGVQVIVKERDQYVAMVGDQTVRVGDELGNGFRVTRIDQSGVHIERKATQ
jgi:hypothetical protein